MSENETNGVIEYKEIVCSRSLHTKRPCKVAECKHHACHLPKSDGVVLYARKDFKKDGECDGCGKKL